MPDGEPDPGLEFSVLGSSSSGNSTLVRGGRTCILVDAGLPVNYMMDKVVELGGSGSIDAILVSHEHSDHIRSLFPLAKRASCPIYISSPVYWYLGAREGFDVRELKDRCTVRIKDLSVTPFLVAHDAIDPFGFVIEGCGGSLGMVTDCGSFDEGVRSMLSGRDGLIVESNYDVDMLRKGVYPASLKRRIQDPKGHLSNDQCRELLGGVIGPTTREIVLAHLSEENNDPLLALETSMKALHNDDGMTNIHVSYPKCPTSVLRAFRQ